MGKQRKGGLPYLKTSLKFNWDSGRGVSAAEQQKLISDIFDDLQENGCRCDTEPSCGDQMSTFINDHAGFGLQACLDLVKVEPTAVVLLDSGCPRPSAVANTLGLYFNNYSRSVLTYCLPGIEEMIWNRLNRKSNSVVLRKCPGELRTCLESTFTTVCVQAGRFGGGYSPVSLINSQGKATKARQ